jgi:enoyl-CoA hydratase/carnithine racemase
MTILAVEHTDILSAQVGGVLTLTLNRPAQRTAMETRFAGHLRAAEADPSVKAIVITGSGDGFCAGADLTALGDVAVTAQDPAADPQAYTPPALKDGPGFALTVQKPLIAAINGGCVGLGFSLALYCDVRFAASGAKIATAFARRGLIAEYATAWLLPRIVGRAHALDLLLSGRTVLAEEALSMGLVQRVLPAAELLAAAQAYAHELATHSSPTSMAIIKGQVNRDGHRDLDAAMAESLSLMVASFGRPDLTEGVAAHVQRRTPNFAPWLPAS